MLKKSTKDSQRNNIPVVLTIAGSDPSSGAGVQADLKTFFHLKVYGLSVISSITIQNTTGIKDVFELPDHVVGSEIEFILNDIVPDVVKIGMVYSKDVAKKISSVLKKYNLKYTVLDPLIMSSSGHYLVRKGHLKDIIENLFPISYLITPNIVEASILTGIEIKNEHHIEKALIDLKKMGPQNILLKGGHLSNNLKGIDFFYNGSEIIYFEPKKVVEHQKDVHGTGCILSSAISANLAKGQDIVTSIKNAKVFIEKIIKNSFRLGHGNNLWM